MKFFNKNTRASLLSFIKTPFFLLFFIGFATYFSSFWNDFVWDDRFFFVRNILTQDLNHIYQIFTSNTTAGAGSESNYYRPLATLSFALDHVLWGGRVFGYHLTNIFFHCLNACFTFLLLTMLRIKKKPAFLIALLFLIHPMQTEAVTYLSSRGDIFYLFFLLLSLLLFTKTLYSSSTTVKLFQRKVTIPKSSLLFISTLLFPLSVLSKEGALTTIPIYAAVLLVFALQKKIDIKTLHRDYKGHGVVILALTWIALVYFGLRLTILNFSDSLNYGGESSIYTTHILIRILTFLRTVPEYVRLFLVPYPLYLERSVPIITSLWNGYVLGAIVLIFFLIGLGIYELRKLHTGWIFFALILIGSNLFSVSGILIPQTGLLRENWMYMPITGCYIIFYIFYSLWLKPLVHAHQKLAWACVIIYCIVLIVMTIQQNYNWRSNLAYFAHNLQFTSTARLKLNLGSAYIATNKLDLALKTLQEGVKISDSYPQTHLDIALIYISQKKLDLAEKELLWSLKIDPGYYYSYRFLIAIYEQEKRYDKAIPYLKAFNHIYLNDSSLLTMYGYALYKNGQKDEAEQEFQRAIFVSKHNPTLLKEIADIKKEN